MRAKAVLLPALLTLLAVPAAAQPHTSVTIGMVQFPPDLHPYVTATSVRGYILAAATRPVTSFRLDGSIVCVLCTEVPSLANGRARLVHRPDGHDGMEVTFTLRPGLFWGDGVPVTARDVAFSATVARAFDLPKAIESVEALDDHDFKVTLSEPRYDFDRWGTVLLPEHVEAPIWHAAADPLDYARHSAFNRDPSNPGLWMGPYRVAYLRNNEAIGMVPNEAWRGPKPAFATVTFRLLENSAALDANLRSGDVDLVAPGNIGITLDQSLALMKTQSDRFDIGFQSSIASYEHFTVRLDDKLLGDVRVRQAIQMGVDRQAIVQRVFSGRAEVADSFLSPVQFGWDPGIRRYAFDPPAARALLAQAGLRPGPDGILVMADGTRAVVDLVTTAGNRLRELIETVFQNEMKAIGIEVRIHNEPARTMFGESLRRRRFTGLVEFQSDLPLAWVPDNTMHSRNIPTEANNWSGQNYAGLADPKMDQAIDAALGALEPDALRAALHRILVREAELLPEIDLFRPTLAVVTPKWLTGVYQPDRWGGPTTWIEEWRPR